MTDDDLDYWAGIYLGPWLILRRRRDLPWGEWLWDTADYGTWEVPPAKG